MVQTKGGNGMKSKLLAYLTELEERYDTGIEYCEDVYDASGGNFDDAYELGAEYGVEDGALQIINSIREFLAKEESE
jgi:hypothetical protein